MRIGIGYDSHRLAEGRRLVIGGVEIPFGKGLVGHSDADVLCHAIMDAILGAAGQGDIGKLFPDTDSAWKDAVSTELLKHVVELARKNGYVIAWIDTIVFAEAPKLSPYSEEMKSTLSRSGLPAGAINIKAKTGEGMGFIGRGEGMAAQAVCLLTRV